MMIMEQRRRDDSKETTNTRPPDETIRPNSKEMRPLHNTSTAFWAGGKSAVSYENGEFTLLEFTDTFGR